MAKIKVETVGAIIDRHPIGSTIELDKKTAEHLESQGYVKIIEEAPKPKAKTKTAKKAASKK